MRVARTELARARHARLSAEQEHLDARLDLAELTGWPLETPPRVPAALLAPRPIPPLAQLLSAASARHPALRAAQAAVAEARARVDVADREPWPAPVLGVQVARESVVDADASYVVLGTIALPLPLWQRNRGERARRRAEHEVARAEQAATTRALRAQLARAHAELVNAAARLALFTADIAPQLEDSLALLRRGFDAGELPLPSVIAAREQLLAAQRDALAAYADYHRALAELEHAIAGELPAAAADAPAGGAP